DKDVNIKTIAKETPGFTGADLANIFNEASLLTARHNKKKISMFEIEDAIERVIAGPEKKTRIISEEEKRIIAYHESGHALLSHILPNTDPIHKISIISRGRALGYVITLPEEDKYLKSKKELLDNITQLLGGRVSEEMNFDDITSGAQNDLDRATKLARKMVTEFGMSSKLGPVTYKIDEEEVFLGKEIISRPHYSEEIASDIDREVHQIISECYEKGRQILIDNRDALTTLANELMDKETLTREEVMKMLFNVKSHKKNSQELAGVSASSASPSASPSPVSAQSSASAASTTAAIAIKDMQSGNIAYGRRSGDDIDSRDYGNKKASGKKNKTKTVSRAQKLKKNSKN
ncbi:MAG: hypothetical protein FJW56_02675, partial [Actinobacteria bacterium]|nr:hypothetical protein [Actinomycetota bacterium]